ncbi:MAG: DUF5103 domain-containing protein [Bacteroidota bacterium]|nr:DUF5103 domain-containing protein [Bacteroidota bacterium]MDX5504495.1 DUF5103 domain-containing protein [Bacteroidota bacterium]
MFRHFLFTTFLTTSLVGFSQDYVNTGEIEYVDRIYSQNIATAQLHPYGDDFAHPIVRLGANASLLLEFDDLDGDFKNYNYTVIHCTSDWKKSDLFPNDYIDGFFQFNITEVSYSANTYQPYSHYMLALPNQKMRFKISGNYLLVIYTDDPERPVLTRRFMVYEDRVSVQMNVKRPTDINYMNTHQEVDFMINTNGYEINDPFRDLKVVVLQNYDWNRAITDLQPRFIGNGQLDYNYETGNLFEGGNEFRFFDTKNLQVLAMNISKTELLDLWNVFLSTDEPRNDEQYTYWEDINGRFIIRKINSNSPNTEADYSWVDFRLDMPNPITNGNVYVYGGFSNRQLHPVYQMTYDYDAKAYRATILMKQGYYNFMYVVKYDGFPQPRMEPIEGNHWETENEYQILVYNRELGKRYDRLVGYSKLQSTLR